MRSKFYFLVVLLCTSSFSFAQLTLRIEITAIPAAHNTEDIFVAGNFNNWNAGDTNYILRKENDKLVLDIKDLPLGTYQFKFTRGSWSTVEATEKGATTENKVLRLFSNVVVQYTIDGWADDFSIPKKNTVSKNVKLIDTAFFMPQLNTSRRIWIYLPPGYKDSKKHYPVMYLQDGQNLFDEMTSAFGQEWGVDECLDSLIAKGKPACIVVGIDNGQATRMSEYNPYEFTWKDSTQSQIILPKGDAYLRFLISTLKPFIDKKYRTLSSKENTVIAGSSMGGLISYYAALKYPEVFGKAGVFSPAFWTAPSIKMLTDSVSKKINGKFFFYMGGLEGSRYIMDMNEVAEKLGVHSNAMIYLVTDAEGSHNEKAWRKWFAEFYKWIMADGYNSVIKVEE